MSFFHTNSAASARSRRNRDKDNLTRTNSITSGGRRAKEITKSQENKSPPSRSPVLQPTLYTQQNLALERLPSTTSNDANVPAPSSPKARPKIVGSAQAGVYQLSHQPYTPAALQQYLEKDGEQDGDEALASAPVDSVPLTSNLHNSLKEDKSASEARRASVISTTSAIQDTGPKDDQRRSAVTRRKGSETVLDAQNRARPFHNANEASKPPTEPLSGVPERSDVNELSKQVTSASDPGVQVEEYYKGLKDPRGVSVKAIRDDGVRNETPKETISDHLKREDHRSVSGESPSTPSPNQRPSSLVTRTFTPPAPRGAFVPPLTPPSLVSPVPLRAQQSGEQYMSFYQPPGYGVRHQPNFAGGYHLPDRHNMRQYAANGPNDLTEMPNRPCQVPVSATSSFIGGHQDNIPSENAFRRYDGVGDTIKLLHDLHKALPGIQMLLTRAEGETKISTATLNSTLEQGKDREATSDEKDQKISQLSRDLDECRARLDEFQKVEREASEWKSKYEMHQKESSLRQKAQDDLVVKNRALEQEKSLLMGQVQDQRTKISIYQTDTASIKAELQAKSQEVLNVQQQLSEAKTTHAHEKETLQAASALQYSDLKAGLEKERDSLNAALRKEQENLSRLLGEKASAEESWKNERESLNKRLVAEQKRFEDELRAEKSSIDSKWSKAFDSQKSEHHASRERLKASLESSLHEEQGRNRSQEAEIDKLRKEIETINVAWDKDKARLSKMTGDFRSAATRLNEQKANMQKMIQAFGETSHLFPEADKVT